MTIEHARLTDEEKGGIQNAITEAGQMARGFPEIIPDDTAGAIFLTLLCQKIIQNSQPPPSMSSLDPGYERERIQMKTRALLDILSQINTVYLGILTDQYPEKKSVIYELVGDLRILANQLYQGHKDNIKVETLRQEWQPRLALRIMALSSTAPSDPQVHGG